MSKCFVLLLAVFESAAALRAYGHAYQAPGDFTDEQYKTIAHRFHIFTVEKRHAFQIYGNSSAAKGTPASYNSIAATVGTARKIKAINASTRVLMYWNSVIHYNMYECESEVQPSWLLSPNPYRAGTPTYNYSVPAFRKWWVSCAVNAVKNSNGAIDGLFIDAVPKVTTLEPGTNPVDVWGKMIEEIKVNIESAATGKDAIILNNGFYLQGNGAKLAGEDAWKHTLATYVESLSTVGKDPKKLALDVKHMHWLANETSQHPERIFMGHGSCNGNADSNSSAQFRYGLAKYLLVTPSVQYGYFLGNCGYNIDQGVLETHSEYDYYHPNTLTLLGEPTGMFTEAQWLLRREFTGGYVEVNLQNQTNTITMK